MSQQKIYKQIISLSIKQRDYTRKELENKLIEISNLCSEQLQKISKQNSDRYKSNENSKLLRTRNNSRRAIKKFWSKRKDRVTRARIYNHLETLRQVYKTIGA